ncbi:MAG: ubiquitin-like domain-containing protein [Promethearchaeota archaeon]
MEFDEDFDENLDEELDDDLDENLDENLDDDVEDTSSIRSEEVIESKTPDTRVISEGKRISIYFMSTIGPGEKKQKLNVNTGNNVGDIKETVANLFGLDPADFHLSSGGVTMDEDSLLLDYNLNDGDDILLIPASTAG